MTIQSHYCEGCESESRPLNKMFYCPVCAEVACEGANAEAVGLLLTHESTKQEIINAGIQTLNNPWVQSLATRLKQCPECEEVPLPHEDPTVDTHYHYVHKSGGVLVGCEGFHTALLLALVKIQRGEEF